MKSVRIKAVVAAGAAAIAVGVVATPHGAAAATTKPQPHSAAHAKSTAGLHPHVSLPGRGVASNTNGITDYGAGYFFYPGATTEGFSSAGVTFTMPSFSCASASDNEWLLPGIWVYDNTGALTQQVDVNFNCNSGVKLQSGIICLSNTGCDSSLTPNPGDVIEASLVETATGTVARLRDFTQNTTATVTGAALSPPDYTVFIGNAGPHQFGFADAVPTFNHQSFRFASVNGEAIGDGDYFPAGYNLRTSGINQINAGPILLHHTMFTNTFKHN
ncbi:MAG: hypothetical protein JO246_04375 [Frankiaceae bacterium]|nr:hypothetical protein [Frankiaceae bacterium]MBV9872261.1 hypothetical protein [Frankiaceae bacterium]